jgi:hypothetical protein
MVDEEQRLENGAANNFGMLENGIELFKVESSPGVIRGENTLMLHKYPFDEKAAELQDAR